MSTIYDQVGNFRTMADFDKERQGAELNKLALLQAQGQYNQGQRAIADDNALRSIYQQANGDPTAVRAGLVSGGQYKAVQAFDKAALENKKAQGEMDLHTAQTIKSKTEARGLDLKQSQDAHDYQLQLAGGIQAPQDVYSWISKGVENRAFSYQEASDMANRFKEQAAQPGFNLGEWVSKTQQGGITAAKRLEQAQALLIANQTNATSRLNNQETNATSRANNASSNATSRANNRDTNATLLQQPEYVQTDLGLMALPKKLPAGQAPQGVMVTDAATGKPVQKGGPDGKMTEDQGKATGWLVQATNAFNNMQAAVKKDKGASTPGLGDVVGSVRGLGGLGNALTSPERQKFNQGASSLSESLLRAATGAGVNRDEANQKIKELTPQIGDSPDVRQQKMEAIPLYIESLKVRAGPGTKKAQAVVAPTNTGPAVGTVENGYRFKGGDPANQSSWEKV